MASRFARTADLGMIADACGFDAFFSTSSIPRFRSTPRRRSSPRRCRSASRRWRASPATTSSSAARLLDAGALGIICPQVETAEQAKALVEACKFPPLGHRSVAGAGPLQFYRPTPLGEVNAQGNALTLCIPMLETPKGIENAAAIAAVPGIDIVLIGSQRLLRRARHSRRPEARENPRRLRDDGDGLQAARQMPRRRRRARRRRADGGTGQARRPLHHRRARPRLSDAGGQSRRRGDQEG